MTVGFRYVRGVGLAFLCTLILSGMEGQAQPSRTITETVDLAPEGEVELNVAAGSVRVATWDRSAVEMHVRIEGETEEQVDNTHVQLEESESQVTIDTEGDGTGDIGFFTLLGFGESNGPETNYTLRVPATASLSITSESAPVEVQGLEGDITVEGASSPVRLDDVAGDVRVATFSGSLEANRVQGRVTFATFSGDARAQIESVAGKSQFASFSGDTHLTLPPDAAFDLRTDVSWGGDVRAEFEGAGAVEDEETVSVGGGGPTIAFESVSGELVLDSE